MLAEAPIRKVWITLLGWAQLKTESAKFPATISFHFLQLNTYAFLSKKKDTETWLPQRECYIEKKKYLKDSPDPASLQVYFWYF